MFIKLAWFGNRIYILCIKVGFKAIHRFQNRETLGFLLPPSFYVFILVGVTIAAKPDYCDSIDIAGSTIAILLLLWTAIAILL